MKHNLTPQEIPLNEINLLKGNPRQGDIGAVAESIRVNGVYQPIIINKGTKTGVPNEVIAGNHRAQAAQQLGYKTIPAIVLDLTEQEAARIALADNRTSDLATYDNEALLVMLQAIDDLEGTGYDGDDIDNLINEINAEVTETLSTENAEPIPLPTNPLTKPGDIYTLGNHKVICGDSLKPETYKNLMGNEKAQIIFTDPPYGVAYVGKTKDALTIQNDTLNLEQLTQFLNTAFKNGIDYTAKGAAWYITAPHGAIGHAFGQSLLNHDIWRHSLVWVKDTFAMGRADYHYRHEAIFYGWTPGTPRLHPVTDRTQDTVWEFPKPSRNADHPTMKPVQLIEKALINSSTKGETVLDMFGGSGSTLLAAENLNRQARIIELDPRYVDVICRRWQDQTGKQPKLNGTPIDFSTI